MKKIVFVQKSEGSYDPVTAYFANRKSASVSKQLPSTIQLIEKQEKTELEKPEKVVRLEKVERAQKGPPKPIVKKTSGISGKKEEKPLQTSINRKGERTSRTITKIESSEEEVIYPQQSQISQHPTHLPPTQMSSANPIDPPHPPNFRREDNQKMTAEITHLRKRVQELTSEVNSLKSELETINSEASIQKSLTNKLQKLQKEMKILQNENRTLKENLIAKESMIETLLAKDDLAIDRKRAALLLNRITLLRKSNAELVRRLKGYRMTETQQIKEHAAMELATEITGEMKQDQDQELDEHRYIRQREIERLSLQVSQKLQDFIKSKSSTKKSNWVDEQKMLTQLVKISEKLSLFCLTGKETDTSHLNLHQQMKLYKQTFKPVLSDYCITDAAADQNIILVNRIQLLENQLQIRPAKITIALQPPTSKLKRSAEFHAYYSQQALTALKSYSEHSNMLYGILAHVICEAGWADELVSRRNREIEGLSGKLSKFVTQLEEVLGLGGSGKQSLWLLVEKKISEVRQIISELNRKQKAKGLRTGELRLTMQ